MRTSPTARSPYRAPVPTPTITSCTVASSLVHLVAQEPGARDEPSALELKYQGLVARVVGPRPVSHVDAEAGRGIGGRVERSDKAGPGDVAAQSPQGLDVEGGGGVERRCLGPPAVVRVVAGGAL